jgi:HAD superfamily hydrolase (TIGR01490 family)
VTPQRAAAFFDLDKTIIAKSSVLAFGRPLYKGGLLSRRAIVRSAYAQVVFMLVGADEAKMEKLRAAMLDMIRGWNQHEVAGIVRETLDEVVTPIIFSEALDLIEEHQAAGRLVVIVSSAPEEVVRPLGEFLGVDDVIATRPEVDERGDYTGELAFYGYGPYKAEAVRELAAREGLDLSASYAYSDSVTDEPMLRAVGHPVAVNPDRDLARLAREEEWPVLRFVRPVRLRDRLPVPSRPTLAVGGALAAAAGGVVVWWWLRRRNHEDA